LPTSNLLLGIAENVKNIVTLPGRLVNNLGNKFADLRTIFSQGKGLVGDFTKSVVVSGAKNAKSLLTKVKGALSTFGTASGAFAKAFGKTYVKECSKYANTCFSVSGAAEAGYKGIVAEFKEAKSALKVVKGEVSNAELNTCDSIKKIINNKGYSVDEFAQLLHPDRVLSDSEELLVASVRKEIGLPSADTLMCKTIPQSDIYKYLYDPKYDGVRGFTAVDEHGANLKTLLDKYNGARLDYNNTEFKTTNGVDGFSKSIWLPDKFYGTIQYKVNDVDKISHRPPN